MQASTKKKKMLNKIVKDWKWVNNWNYLSFLPHPLEPVSLSFGIFQSWSLLPVKVKINSLFSTEAVEQNLFFKLSGIGWPVRSQDENWVNISFLNEQRNTACLITEHILNRSVPINNNNCIQQSVSFRLLRNLIKADKHMIHCAAWPMNSKPTLAASRKRSKASSSHFKNEVQTTPKFKTNPRETNVCNVCIYVIQTQVKTFFFPSCNLQCSYWKITL